MNNKPWAYVTSAWSAGFQIRHNPRRAPYGHPFPETHAE